VILAYSVSLGCVGKWTDVFLVGGGGWVARVSFISFCSLFVKGALETLRFRVYAGLGSTSLLGLGYVSPKDKKNEAKYT
jgi:hypothetical protein